MDRNGDKADHKWGDDTAHPAIFRPAAAKIVNVPAVLTMYPNRDPGQRSNRKEIYRTEVTRMHYSRPDATHQFPEMPVNGEIIALPLPEGINFHIIAQETSTECGVVLREANDGMCKLLVRKVIDQIYQTVLETAHIKTENHVSYNWYIA